MVPKAGLEPARLAPLPPQDSVSTNSTTWAILFIIQQEFLDHLVQVSLHLNPTQEGHYQR